MELCNQCMVIVNSFIVLVVVKCKIPINLEQKKSDQILAKFTGSCKNLQIALSKQDPVGVISVCFK